MLMFNKNDVEWVSKRNLGFDPPNVDRLSGEAALCCFLEGESPEGRSQVKLQRAHGGCLGIERRRRTRLPAISQGELDVSVEPWISEWGNPSGIMARHHAVNT